MISMVARQTDQSWQKQRPGQSESAELTQLSITYNQESLPNDNSLGAIIFITIILGDCSEKSANRT